MTGAPRGASPGFARNGSGDVTGITQPDGEIISFQYDDAHHMMSKTTRGSDTTTYAYNADGTLHSATKPEGRRDDHDHCNAVGRPAVLEHRRAHLDRDVHGRGTASRTPS